MFRVIPFYLVLTKARTRIGRCRVDKESKGRDSITEQRRNFRCSHGRKKVQTSSVGDRYFIAQQEELLSETGSNSKQTMLDLLSAVDE